MKIKDYTNIYFLSAFLSGMFTILFILSSGENMANVIISGIATIICFFIFVLTSFREDRQRGLNQAKAKYQKVYVVGESLNDNGTWAICGVFSEEKKAVSECKGNKHFVGPIPMNISLPDELQNWPGLYYPLQLDSFN